MSAIQDQPVSTYHVQINDFFRLLEYGRFHPIIHATGHDVDLNFDDQELIVMSLAAAEPPPVMVPTDGSAIASLKRVCADELSDVNTDEVCSICLEKWAKEEVLVCLPCNHVFHEECIIRWFNTSHFCPLCRFELPSTQDR